NAWPSPHAASPPSASFARRSARWRPPGRNNSARDASPSSATSYSTSTGRPRFPTSGLFHLRRSPISRAEIAHTECKLDRYYDAFESGKLSAADCHKRVHGHAARHETLREQEADL